MAGSWSGMQALWPALAAMAHSASSTELGRHPRITIARFSMSTHTVGLCLAPVFGSIPINHMDMVAAQAISVARCRRASSEMPAVSRLQATRSEPFGAEVLLS